MHYYFWFFDNNNNNIQGPKKRPRKVYQYMNVTQSWVLSKRACGVRSSRILREEEEEEEVTMRRGTFHARPQHQWRFFREIDIFHGKKILRKKCGHKNLIITKVIFVDFVWEEEEEVTIADVWRRIFLLSHQYSSIFFVVIVDLSASICSTFQADQYGSPAVDLKKIIKTKEATTKV